MYFSASIISSTNCSFFWRFCFTDCARDALRPSASGLIRSRQVEEMFARENLILREFLLDKST